MANCYVLRHSDTEWSRSGQHTSTTDLPLLPEGISRVEKTKHALVGEGKVIEPSRIRAIYVSPLHRARQTLELLEIHDPEIEVIVTDKITEWNYGKYEGLTSKQIREDRKSRGLDKERDWDIWQDGCEGEGAEGPGDVAKRVDELIAEIREKHHLPVLESKENLRRTDVLVVAHGHSLRSFATRWIGKRLQEKVSLVLDPASIGKLTLLTNEVRGVT